MCKGLATMFVLTPVVGMTHNYVGCNQLSGKELVIMFLLIYQNEENTNTKMFFLHVGVVPVNVLRHPSGRSPLL